MRAEDTYFDRDVEKVFLQLSQSEYEAKTAPSTLLAKHLGNMYTGSVYGGLASLLAQTAPAELVDKRVVLFSYGSGLAASMFSLIAREAPVAMCGTLAEAVQRLEQRCWVEPAEFDRIMKLRDHTHNRAPYTPTADARQLFPDTYYLAAVDEKFRRTYGYVDANGVVHAPGTLGATGAIAINGLH